MGSWRPNLFLASIALAGLSRSFQQVEVAQLGYEQEACPVSTEDLRVLPDDFNRAVLVPFTNTSLNGSGLISEAAYLQPCQFQSFDPSFDSLLGSNRTIYQLGPDRTYNWAHEGAAYLPDTNEVLVISDNKSPGQINRVSLDTGTVTSVLLERPIGAANGAIYHEGQVFVATFGDYKNGIPAGILLLDPYNGTWTWALNNWFGLRFNGPNDLVLLDDGSLIFTDSVFGVNAGFAPGGQLQEGVYLIPPTGPVRVLISQVPETVNGLALSPDQQTLYVSTTAASISVAANEVSDHSIFAFDMVRIGGGLFAQNSRTFALIDHGFPDGFKLDDAGNLFASSADGVQVFNPAGSLIGKIIIPVSQSTQQNVNNLVFVGNRLVLLHNTNVLVLTLNTTG